MTRLWPDGDTITMTTVAEEPDRFTWQGQTHQVLEITRRWRVDVDWWRMRVWRAYYKLRTDTGLLVIVYRDLLTGQWYLQRLYD
jgi:hypothetical protein